MKKIAIKSQVLSTRVPVDVMNTIDSICKQQGVNRSQWLTTTVSEMQSNNFLKEGGQLQTRTMPLELQNLLLTAGVTTVGILSYNLVGNAVAKVVDKDGKFRFSNGEVEFISIITAVAIALAGFGMVKSLINE
jgi:hypothetical protein